MGNLCIRYNNKPNKKIKCIKCNDTINIYKNNTRKHCREHTINKNGICIDCNLNTKNSNKNCRHIGQNNWYDFLFN